MVMISIFDLEGFYSTTTKRLLVKIGSIMKVNINHDGFRIVKKFSFVLYDIPKWEELADDERKAVSYMQKMIGSSWRYPFFEQYKSCNTIYVFNTIARIVQDCIIFTKGKELEENFFNTNNINGKYVCISQKPIIRDIGEMINCLTFNKFCNFTRLGQILIKIGIIKKRRNEYITNSDKKKIVKDGLKYVPIHKPHQEICYFFMIIKDNKLYDRI